MDITEVVNMYYAWLPIEVATPHPLNTLYIPSQMILVLGRDKYISEFARFFDEKIAGKYDMDKDWSIEAVKRQAYHIAARHVKDQIRYPHNTTQRKKK